MKKLFLLMFVSVCFSTMAQTNLNAYKYVIVPETFDFLKKPNLYQMNALTQFLLEKEGFIAIMENATMPEDLNANGCLALRVNVLNESGMFTTKLKVVLKDCKGSVVFESDLGTTKEKEYKKAYQLALRDAFKSFEDINYEYKPAAVANVVAPVTATAETAAVTSNTVTSEAVKPVSDVLYAQAITNGYQLVDSTPKVVYILKETNIKDVFLVQGKQATVRKLGDQWVLEFYEGETLKQSTLNIKF
ncbi:hypothetical protein FNB79_07235 [Formosa sediminum]|uniref:DUF4468 domain-containing protein n=1 Tax=Formosa sediminum TaxID=2594004 RepID=A0A516GQI3_9FLAO|nr:hypothetical protein [Formosa sediminum]QDO93778.1 hypothetical protein FNB79_07235 [Formosa sediminum]